MKTDDVILYSSYKNQFTINDFEEAFLNSMRRYSIRNLPFTQEISPENILEALQKSVKVCHLAGINSRDHFKKVFVYDADVHTVHIDWRMTKKGLNLMVMQTPELNEKMARWLCELADL
ncbi:MAG: hypothetical protein V4585_18155 [Bacteroidota bacterium]|jgi:hypothetical protein